MATKTVDLRKLRTELLIREWTRVFKNHRYLGFVGFTSGIPWKSLFLRQRIMENLPQVDARYCKNWEGREVCEKLGWKELKPLFMGFPCAVCFSNDGQEFQKAVKRALSLIPGSLLLGAKIDHFILTGPKLQQILATSLKELQTQLLASLQRDTSLLVLLSQSNQQLINVFSNPMHSLTIVLEQYQKSKS
eukprot:jgi/Galph1/5183/GphlegSOOS_G3874.1